MHVKGIYIYIFLNSVGRISVRTIAFITRAGSNKLRYFYFKYRNCTIFLTLYSNTKHVKMKIFYLKFLKLLLHSSIRKHVPNRHTKSKRGQAPFRFYHSEWLHKLKVWLYFCFSKIDLFLYVCLIDCLESMCFIFS